MTQFDGFTQETLQFLAAIKGNNNKQWFEKNKSIFKEEVQHKSQDFVMAMDDALKSISPELGGDVRLNGSGSIFRIYRDVRFSKDKTPYKTHLGILFWDKRFKKMSGPGFYFHLEPPKLSLYCGVYEIPRDKMSDFRDGIADNKSGKQLLEIIDKGEKMGFEISEPHYKRFPTGYDVEDERKTLLLHNTLFFKKTMTIPNEIFSENLIDYTLKVWEKMAPVYFWLKNIM